MDKTSNLSVKSRLKQFFTKNFNSGESNESVEDSNDENYINKPLILKIWFGMSLILVVAMVLCCIVISWSFSGDNFIYTYSKSRTEHFVLPEITICPSNIMNLDKLNTQCPECIKWNLTYYKYHQFWTEYFNTSLSIGISKGEKSDSKFYAMHNMINYKESKSGFRYAEEVIFACSFGHEKCSFLNFTTLILPNMFSCFTYQNTYFTSSNKVGKHYGLSILLHDGIKSGYYQSSDYRYQNMKGFNIFITEKSALINPRTFKIEIPVGSSADIHIKQINYKMIPRSNDPCIVNNDIEHSQNMCRLKYLQNYYQTHCGCLNPDYYYPQNIANLYNVSNCLDIPLEIVANNSDNNNYNFSEIIDGKFHCFIKTKSMNQHIFEKSKCLNRCNREKYITEVMLQNWPRYNELINTTILYSIQNNIRLCKIHNCSTDVLQHYLKIYQKLFQKKKQPKILEVLQKRIALVTFFTSSSFADILEASEQYSSWNYFSSLANIINFWINLSLFGSSIYIIMVADIIVRYVKSRFCIVNCSV